MSIRFRGLRLVCHSISACPAILRFHPVDAFSLRYSRSTRRRHLPTSTSKYHAQYTAARRANGASSFKGGQTSGVELPLQYIILRSHILLFLSTYVQ
ncbi:hypothetical protein BDV19DRAFT_50504 [Aspergillus venezuelensis]